MTLTSRREQYLDPEAFSIASNAVYTAVIRVTSTTSPLLSTSPSTFRHLLTKQLYVGSGRLTLTAANP